MPRPLRYLPPECPLVEVTCRTLHGRLLLRPSKELNRLVLGVLARAARLHDVGVCAFVFLSNHCHLLLRPKDAQELSAFMNYLDSNLARGPCSQEVPDEMSRSVASQMWVSRTSRQT